jgi:nicotinamide-nucleotide amidase
MQADYIRRCSLCLLKEKEVAPFLQTLKESHPEVEMALFPGPGGVQVLFQSERSVDGLVEQVQEKFPSFFYGEGRIEEAVGREFIERKKTLALAESCTGGALAAKLTAIPHASQYLQGSIVAYSNGWKERFLQVSRTSLEQRGAASREVVVEMVRGLFQETEADVGVAVSGVAGPGGGTKATPVGTIFIAIGVRGEKIDAGVIHGPTNDRNGAIDMAVHLILGALWRRLAHNTTTFS